MDMSHSIGSGGLLLGWSPHLTPDLLTLFQRLLLWIFALIKQPIDGTYFEEVLDGSGTVSIVKVDTDRFGLRTRLFGVNFDRSISPKRWFSSTTLSWDEPTHKLTYFYQSVEGIKTPVGSASIEFTMGDGLRFRRASGFFQHQGFRECKHSVIWVLIPTALIQAAIGKRCVESEGDAKALLQWLLAQGFTASKLVD